jgi:hypothetical protein
MNLYAICQWTTELLQGRNTVHLKHPVLSSVNYDQANSLLFSFSLVPSPWDIQSWYTANPSGGRRGWFSVLVEILFYVVFAAAILYTKNPGGGGGEGKGKM